jgi:hypothetical protein
MVLGQRVVFGESNRMEFFIGKEGCFGMFQFLFRDPGIFFGCVSFPSDQIKAVVKEAFVTNDLKYFEFLFALNKVSRWGREVRAMYRVFAIGQ